MMTSKIASCEVVECAYNKKKLCHAKAITVGDNVGVHAMCDTYLKTDIAGGEESQIAEVGACKVSACRHNEELECVAGAIKVGYHTDHPDCMTFIQR